MSPMFFLGLVSSDSALCHAVSEQLKHLTGDWQCAVFPSLEEALAAWSDALPPLILWDTETARAPDELIDFLAHRMSERHPAPLLLILGPAHGKMEQICLTEVFLRPLRLGYLITRLQFYQRLLQKAPDVSIALGPWDFLPRARSATNRLSGEVLKLTEKEAALLEYLCSADTPVSREELLASIWGYEPNIDTHTLETHIYRLRRKLMDKEDGGVDVFVTDNGGYQFNPGWRKG